MNITYKLALELKEKGFPQHLGKDAHFYYTHNGENRYRILGNIDTENNTIALAPTLEELIEACGDSVFFDLVKLKDGWVATDHYYRGESSTPEEAVARLYIALNKPN